MVARGAPHAGAFSCANAALASQRPFFVSFHVMGTDSQIHLGLVLTNEGVAQQATWDSDVWGGSKLFPERRVSWRACPRPSLSFLNDDVELACNSE